ncbi:MAG TPA: hemerythrin domain-containing protein [Alphaproteobacteria bacterium]|nr:hemerythrin domain-containing protein [Alphaproteobacteria bacterium]
MTMSTETAACATYDFYAPIHKGLRAASTQLLVRIGATDFADPAATAALLGALRRQLALAAAHLEHEDRHIHAALEARAPGASGTLESQHDDHRAGFAELAGLIAGIEAAGPAARPALGHRLYLAYSRFVAEDFEHMAEEETVVLPELQRLFSDAELMAIEGAILAEIEPPEMMEYMRLMLPAMNRTERAGLLGLMRQGAPPEAFAAVLDHAARPLLPPEEWRDLAARLDLAA